MVWIKWSDYGKPKRKKITKPKSKKSKIESKIKIIPGTHKVEFRKASEI